MIKNIDRVSIGSVWNAGTGATAKDNILAEPDFSPEIKLAAPILSELMIVRMKDGVMAVFSDFSTKIELTCSKCLDKYLEEIQVDSFERQFEQEMPRTDYDPLETFLINQKDTTIDLTESLRQEIILHFPMIPVCSESCQGLCASCAANLNHEKHREGCTDGQKVIKEDATGETHKPFANLKNLLN